jgi:uncharacterized membrane protein
MIRKRLLESRNSGEPDFHWRGHEVTRLEGFTDAVFAFAVTLLVVSLEVPNTFPELMRVMRGFPAFGACFALLTNLWYQHYRFFRRYGLESPWVVALNCALLFFVLFYVYPLKFLFSATLTLQQFVTQDARVLFTIYGLGWAAVFLVFVLLYQYAWKHRNELQLNALERLRTRASLIANIAMLLVGVISTMIAWLVPPDWMGLAGYFYFVIPIYFMLEGRRRGRREQLAKSVLADRPAE